MSESSESRGEWIARRVERFSSQALRGRPVVFDDTSNFMSIERARFRKPVVPGDQLRYEVEVLRLRETHAKLQGRAFVDGQLAAEAIVSSVLVDD